VGVSSRTVQRHLEELERLELVRRVREAWESDPDVKVTKFDPSGLVEQLKGLESRLPTKAQRLAAETAVATRAPVAEQARAPG
jgi:DeoR/GlpR family transcriptional regulator of sugar metabolism